MQIAEDTSRAVEQGPKAQTVKLGRQPVPILHTEIIFVCKNSSLQRAMMERGSSLLEIEAIYKEDGRDFQRELVSHQRQLAARAVLSESFLPSQFVDADLSNDEIREMIRKAQLVVSFGGDNHFQRVSHLIDPNTPILGINSDKAPNGSTGALLPYSAESFLESLGSIENGEYKFEPWTRISVEINVKKVGVATCEVFLGEDRRPLMSGYRLYLRDKVAEHKSSGLVVSNGAGSTGWFDNAISSYFPEGLQFPKTERTLRFVATEAFRRTWQKMQHGAVYEGEELVVESRNDDKGIIELDSLETFPFERGKKARLTVEQDPLWVIVPNAD